MKLKTTKSLLALSLSAFATFATAAPYEVVDLGGLGGNLSSVYDINAAGQSVGYSNGPLDENNNRTFVAHAVQYDDAGNIDLGTLNNGTSSEAVGINDAMVSVGFSSVVTETEENTAVENFAVVFEGNTVSKLEVENLSEPVAYDINNNNQIILGGLFDVAPGNDDIGTPDRAFVYDRNTDEYTMIEPLAEGQARSSYVTSINQGGDIVGFSDIEQDDSFSIASYITNAADVSTITEIETIDDRAMFARSINDNREVVGNIYISGTRDQREAFYIDMSAANPELKLLGFLGQSFEDSRANDINNMGQIVGKALVSVPTIGEFNAFLYENDEMKNLNDLIACDSSWILSEARAINDAGQIVGIGAFEGEVRAFRLDPTGEPVEGCADDSQPIDNGGSMPMVIVAILGILGLRRRFQ